MHVKGAERLSPAPLVCCYRCPANSINFTFALQLLAERLHLDNKIENVVLHQLYSELILWDSSISRLDVRNLSITSKTIFLRRLVVSFPTIPTLPDIRFFDGFGVMGGDG